jgi:hypothetical protein
MLKPWNQSPRDSKANCTKELDCGGSSVGSPAALTTWGQEWRRISTKEGLEYSSNYTSIVQHAQGSGFELNPSREREKEREGGRETERERGFRKGRTEKNGNNDYYIKNEKEKSNCQSHWGPR